MPSERPRVIAREHWWRTRPIPHGIYRRLLKRVRETSLCQTGFEVGVSKDTIKRALKKGRVYKPTVNALLRWYRRTIQED